MTSLINTFKKYTSFKGCATCSEFWTWAVFMGAVAAVSLAIIYLYNTLVPYPVVALFVLPTLAVTVRRLHDAGHSGWWVLLWVLLLLGTVLFGFCSGYLLQNMSPGDTITPFTKVFMPILALVAAGYSLLMLFWLAAPGIDR